MMETLSAGEARRIALAAQGLADPRPPGPVSRRALRALAARLGVLQLDSVNVFARAHYMPPFARLGPYPPALLENEAWGRRPSLFEYWGHAASLMPVGMQPLFRWRMAERRQWPYPRKSRLAEFGHERASYVAQVLDEIRRRGPVTGGDFADERRGAGWWSWSDGKMALEWLFAVGEITTRTRQAFERVYDLTERVIPPAVLAAPTPGPRDARRALVEIAARAMGVASLADLADYFRFLQADTRVAVDELVEAGALAPVSVEGWRERAWVYSGARTPRRARGAALLSPFDNLVWRRERAQRLFGVRLRIEIYTPSHQREHGYYVLLFLLGDAVAARVDLKSDRKAGRLLVQAAHLEPGAAADEVVGPLAAELRAAAGWQGLAEVAIMKKGGLSAALSQEFG